MSNPDEPPGENREVDEGYLAKMRARLAALVPVTAQLGLRRIWAATIDYTPDHLPIIGRAPGLDGVTVACAASAGMMPGPGVAATADVALTAPPRCSTSPPSASTASTSQPQPPRDDPIALPFPERIAS